MQPSQTSAVTFANAIDEIIVCPTCRLKLVKADDRYGCMKCQTVYPSLDGVICLVPSVSHWLLQWSHALMRAEAQTAHTVEQIDNELKNPKLSPTTVGRLNLLKDGLKKWVLWDRAVLSPLTALLGTAAPEFRPSGFSVEQYYENLLRDWVWDNGENEEVLRRVREVAGSQPWGRTLFLGAGACRLAYDLHHAFSPTLSVAVDWNPVLMLAARRVMKGEKLEWVELPEYAKRWEDSVVFHHPPAKPVVRQDFVQVFADALQTPFLAESFDTIVTPWFIDIVSEDLSGLVPKINSFLKPGGRWINVGPLTFGKRRASQIFSKEETLELVGKNGFAVGSSEFSSIPYMQSPYASRTRTESVLTFVATKIGPAVSPQTKNRSAWLNDTDLPVPLAPQFSRSRDLFQLQAKVLGMVDGKRSIKKMAESLSKEVGLPWEQIEKELVFLFEGWSAVG